MGHAFRIARRRQPDDVVHGVAARERERAVDPGLHLGHDVSRDRARRIVSVIAGTDMDRAGRLLDEADG